MSDYPEDGSEANPASSATGLRLMRRIGWSMFGVWATTLVVWGAVRPEPYAQGWRLVVELAFLGRLLNVADGIGSGFSRVYLLIQSGPQDVILLLLVYPLVVSAYEGAERSGLIRRSIDTVRKTAERNMRFVEPFGAIGLWIFVFFPFWSTGVLVGGVVGYLLGLRTWVVFGSVLSGHFISVVSLIWFFEFTYEAAYALSEGTARFVPWFVLGLLLLLMLVSRKYRSRRNKKASDDDPRKDETR